MDDDRRVRDAGKPNRESEASPRPDDLLLARIKSRQAALEELLREVSSHWGYEDPVYRFYHQSFKVYHLQSGTERIVDALRDLGEGRPLNAWFLEIIAAGIGRRFTHEVNKNWTAETRPIVEAFFHARYFLEMICKYGRELETAPDLLPSGWASVLSLYGLR